MSWNSQMNGFHAYLMLERGLSQNTIDAYMGDIEKLSVWAESNGLGLALAEIKYDHLENFVAWLNDLGLEVKSQARVISGIKAFFKYLLIEDLITDDPSDLLEGPKLRRKIPDVLSIKEMDHLLTSIDLSHPQGHRNKAILEVLYACGLRVSELTSLKLSNYYPDIGLIKVIGKNDKERIIPIGRSAIKFIDWYIHHDRNQVSRISKQAEDVIFLTRRGNKMSRVMIFYIVKTAARDAEIKKKISPHTFRHSFATHLVEGGADLKAIQDMLGHESITTTEIYTHLDTRYLRETILTYHPRNRIQES